MEWEPLFREHHYFSLLDHLIWLRAPGSHRAVAAYETAWVPNRPARINAAKALNSLACHRDLRVPCDTIGGALDA
jgi:hypothetical protein